MGAHVDGDVANLREWAAVPLWDACDGGLVLWSPKRTEVQWLDSLGQTTLAVPVRVTTDPLSLQDIERYLRWMGRLELGPEHEGAGVDYERAAIERRTLFSDRRPFATDLKCESYGTAWLRLFDTASDPLGRSGEWLRVPMDRAFERVRFPVEFTPVLFTPEGVYGLYESPEGYQRLAWWDQRSLGNPSVL